MSGMVIGLTGPMGAGKSTVAAILRELGAEVLQADQIVREERRMGTPGHREIVEHFGAQVLASGGEIDARKLASLVFADPRQLERLEALMHPRVRERVRDAIASLADGEVLVIEAIKLLEGPLRGLCDRVWIVTAPRDLLLARAAARGVPFADATARLNAQADDATFRAAADEVIVNDGDLAATRARVADLYARLTGRPGSGS